MAILLEGLLSKDSEENSQDQTAKKVLVIGGGIAGLTAAWELAGLNLDVKLVERSSFNREFQNMFLLDRNLLFS